MNFGLTRFDLLKCFWSFAVCISFHGNLRGLIWGCLYKVRNDSYICGALPSAATKDHGAASAPICQRTVSIFGIIEMLNRGLYRKAGRREGNLQHCLSPSFPAVAKAMVGKKATARQALAAITAVGQSANYTPGSRSCSAWAAVRSCRTGNRICSGRSRCCRWARRGRNLPSDW